MHLYQSILLTIMSLSTTLFPCLTFITVHFILTSCLSFIRIFKKSMRARNSLLYSAINFLTFSLPFYFAKAPFSDFIKVTIRSNYLKAELSKWIRRNMSKVLTATGIPLLYPHFYFKTFVKILAFIFLSVILGYCNFFILFLPTMSM